MPALYVLFVILCAIGAGAIARVNRKRRLLTAGSEEKTEPLIERERRYFSERGFRIAEAMSTPRAADLGVIHLTHEKVARWQDDWEGTWHSKRITCDYGCGEVIVFVDEIVPTGSGSGVKWMRLGQYCSACGACLLSCRGPNEGKPGPLEARLHGATNLFDMLGNPKRETPEDEWRRLAKEETALEERLGQLRCRRLALAESLGKPLLGGPMRLELPAKTGT